MTNQPTIDGVPLELLKIIEMTWRQASGFSNTANDAIAKGLGELRELLAANPEENGPCPQCGGSLRTWGCNCDPRWPMVKPVIEQSAPVPAAGPWIDGSPPSPWGSEAFLAQTVEGHKVVLRPLPEEYSYDFQTADGTHMMRGNITKWAQLSTSDFVDYDGKPEAEQPAPKASEPVTLPGRKVPNGNMGQNDMAQCRGFNRCLDEVAELGPLYRHPAEQPAPIADEPVTLAAVAVLRDDGDGGLEPEWLLEGGTAELVEGTLLLVADDQSLCAEDGHAELYRRAPGAQE